MGECPCLSSATTDLSQRRFRKNKKMLIKYARGKSRDVNCKTSILSFWKRSVSSFFLHYVPNCRGYVFISKRLSCTLNGNLFRLSPDNARVLDKHLSRRSENNLNSNTICSIVVMCSILWILKKKRIIEKTRYENYNCALI